MRRAFTAGMAAVLFALAAACQARAADGTDPNAVVDKAIKAMGGEEALGKVKAASWTSKGTISFNNNDNEITNQVTIQGIDHFRQEMNGSFGGNEFKGLMLVSGDKGSMTFGDNHRDLEGEGLANQKRTVYLQVVPMTLVALKTKDFKVAATEDATVGGKPAAGIQVTGPDGKTFRLYFDKETGLPAKLVATVVGFNNNEFTQETTYSDYKEMGGIKVATKVTSTRDGQKFIDSQISDFKVLDTVPPAKFTEAG